MPNKLVNSTILESFASNFYKKLNDNLDQRLDGKTFKYLTQDEFDLLSEEEKNREDILYQITDKQLSYNDLIDLPEIPSIEGLASEDFVREEIAKAQLADEEVDLTGYATKAEVEAAIAGIEHPQYDDSELRGMIEAIEVPSVEGLATEEYVMEALGGKRLRYVTSEKYEQLSEEEKNREDILYQITDKQLSYNDLVDKPDLNIYATKEEVPNITIVTQAEYDALEAAGQEDPDTFYLISDEL